METFATIFWYLQWLNRPPRLSCLFRPQIYTEWMVIIYFFCQQPPPTTRNTAAQMTTRTNTARGAIGGPLKPAGAAPPPSAAPVKKESTPYKPLPIPPTFDLDLDSTQLKEAIAKLGYDPHGKIPTSLLVRPKANSSIPGMCWNYLGIFDRELSNPCGPRPKAISYIMAIFEMATNIICKCELSWSISKWQKVFHSFALDRWNSFKLRKIPMRISAT